MSSNPIDNKGPSLVTGGTGLLGSHIVEQLRKQDKPVRAVCRPGSDRSFLEAVGAEVVDGDITDPDSLHRACADVETIYHAAARVGDWASAFLRLGTPDEG